MLRLLRMFMKVQLNERSKVPTGNIHVICSLKSYTTVINKLTNAEMFYFPHIRFSRENSGFKYVKVKYTKH